MLPTFDADLSALLGDLSEHGLLDSTIVLALVADHARASVRVGIDRAGNQAELEQVSIDARIPLETAAPLRNTPVAC